jgi:hypothetical protein
MALVVKTCGPPTAIVAAVRRIVRDLAPTVPIFNVETMGDVVRAGRRSPEHHSATGACEAVFPAKTEQVVDAEARLIALWASREVMMLRYRAEPRRRIMAPSHTHGNAETARAIGYQSGARSYCVMLAIAPSVPIAKAMTPSTAA